MPQYSASAVSRPFWYVEFKKVASLLNQGHSYDEIRTKALEDNIFDVAKEYRAKEIFGAVSRRTKVYDEEGIRLFCASDLGTMKLMAFIAIMATDHLLADFMHQVFQEKVYVADWNLRDSDFNTYFKRIQDHNEETVEWKDYTLKKLRNSFINYLAEGGLLSREGTSRTIKPAIISDELATYLKRHDLGAYITMLTGVRQ